MFLKKKVEICLLIRLLSCHPTILQYLTAEFTTSALLKTTKQSAAELRIFSLTYRNLTVPKLHQGTYLCVYPV